MSKPFPSNLAGLLTAGGKYSPAYWQQLCGSNPLDFPEYFKVVGGFVYCTMQYRVDYELHILQARQNWNTLGVKA
jgi:hypothetical protein